MFVEDCCIGMEGLILKISRCLLHGSFSNLRLEIVWKANFGILSGGSRGSIGDASLRCLPLLTDVWRLKNGTEISGAEEFWDERELDKQ